MCNFFYFFLSLIGYCFHQFFDLFRVSQEIVISNVQVFIKLKYVKAQP